MPERVYTLSIKFINLKDLTTVVKHYSHCYSAWNTSTNTLTIRVDFSDSDIYFKHKFSLSKGLPIICKLKCESGGKKMLLGRSDMFVNSHILMKTKLNDVTVPFHIPIAFDSQNCKGECCYLLKYPEAKLDAPSIIGVEIKIAKDVADKWLIRFADFCQQ